MTFTQLPKQHYAPKTHYTYETILYIKILISATLNYYKQVVLGKADEMLLASGV